MKNIYRSVLMASTILFAACSKETDYVEIISPDDIPQIIFFDDEGDGDVEDADEVKIKLALVERVDDSGEELAGTVVPLTTDATVSFSIVETNGFVGFSEYITGVEAIYEIDDCTEGEIVDVSLNLTTGEGTVVFPAGIEEIELVISVDESLFDDDLFNADGRGFIAQLTSVSSTEDVVANTDNEFEYIVLDDESVFGEWELDHEDSTLFNQFVSLFGLVNEDIAALEMADVDGIEVEFKYDELAVVVKLVEEEEVEDCGEIEMDNIEIELEMEYDDLTDDALEGEASFEGEIEFEDGSVAEYSYEGEFSISGTDMMLTLVGEYDDEETEEITLKLSK